MYFFESLIAAWRRRQWTRLDDGDRGIISWFNKLNPEEQDALRRELAEHKKSYKIYRKKSQAELKRKLRDEQKALRKALPEIRRKHQEWLDNFALLAEVEKALGESEISEQRMAWLCESIQKLTNTSGFVGFQDLRSEAWIAAANLHGRQGNKSDELDCLEYALQLNPKAPVKRRVKALKSGLVKR